jgi:DHA3 family macrolide efflux protein-like MFS transporter
MISQVGDSLTKVALLWFVYELTGSTFKTTMIGLLQTIPPMLLGPAIGVFLDRLPKKTVMIWLDLIRAVLLFLIPLLHVLEVLSLPRLYLLVFLISIFSSAFGPALASAVPQLVPRGQLTAANALLQTTTNIGMLAGPAISGLGIAVVGAHNVLYLNVATFTLSAVCLLGVRLSHTRGPSFPSSKTFLRDALVGFRFVASHPMIFALMVGAGLYSMGASALVFLLPALGKSHFGIGAGQLGALWSSMGIGMLLASLWLSWLKHRDVCARLRLVAGALVLGGAAMVGLAMLKSVAFATFFMVVTGSSVALFTPIIWGFLQELSPEDFLARVLTTFNTGAMTASMAGMILFGWAADAFAPQVSLLGASVTFLGTAAILMHVGRQYGFPAVPEVSAVQSSSPIKRYRDQT